MKKSLYLLASFGAVFLMTTTGCKKNESSSTIPVENSPLTSGQVNLDDVISDLKKIRKLGFDPSSAEITPDGYRVEGDIRLTKKHLNESVTTLPEPQGQYSTKYALALGRTINVALYDQTNTPKFNSAFDSTVVALKNLKLPLKFVRVADTARADIIILFKDLGGSDAKGSVTLGQDGAFIDSQGTPGKHIYMNSNPAAGYTTASRAYITSILNHEFGHAIGLRHTDYKNRLYSSLRSNGVSPTAASIDEHITTETQRLFKEKFPLDKWEFQTAATKQRLKNDYAKFYNEGDESGMPNDRASHIYGTPLTPLYGVNTATDPTSIMLAVTSEQFGNLNFSLYDNIALFGLYASPAQKALIRKSLSENGAITAQGKTLAQIVTEVKNLAPKN